MVTVDSFSKEVLVRFQVCGLSVWSLHVLPYSDWYRTLLFIWMKYTLLVVQLNCRNVYQATGSSTGQRILTFYLLSLRSRDDKEQSSWNVPLSLINGFLLLMCLRWQSVGSHRVVTRYISSRDIYSKVGQSILIPLWMDHWKVASCCLCWAFSLISMKGPE